MVNRRAGSWELSFYAAGFACTHVQKGMGRMRYTWKARVLPGKLEEYIRRHDEIWPEMTETLNRAGIRNYTIWNLRDELFGYYECDDLDYALRVQADSPVVARWNVSMEGIMVMDGDPVTGELSVPRQVFLHGGV